MNITGKLHVKFNSQQVSERFSKREFVVEYAENPMYPQLISFQLIQDKVDLLDPFDPGQMINVSFNLRGRSWISPQGETKYFNSLEAWRIQSVEQQPDTPPPAPGPVQDVSGDDDDLPF